MYVVICHPERAVQRIKLETRWKIFGPILFYCNNCTHTVNPELKYE